MNSEVDNLVARWPSTTRETACRVLNLVERVAPVTELRVKDDVIHFFQGTLWGKVTADGTKNLIVTFHGADNISDPGGLLSGHGDSRSVAFQHPSDVPMGTMVGFVQAAVRAALQRQSRRSGERRSG